MVVVYWPTFCFVVWGGGLPVRAIFTENMGILEKTRGPNHREQKFEIPGPF